MKKIITIIIFNLICNLIFTEMGVIDLTKNNNLPNRWWILDRGKVQQYFNKKQNSNNKIIFIGNSNSYITLWENRYLAGSTNIEELLAEKNMEEQLSNYFFMIIYYPVSEKNEQRVYKGSVNFQEFLYEIVFMAYSLKKIKGKIFLELINEIKDKYDNFLFSYLTKEGVKILKYKKNKFNLSEAYVCYSINEKDSLKIREKFKKLYEKLISSNEPYKLINKILNENFSTR